MSQNYPKVPTKKMGTRRKKNGDGPLFFVEPLHLICEFRPSLRQSKVTGTQVATVPASQPLGFGRHVTTFGDALFFGKTQKFDSVQLGAHSDVLCHDQCMHGHAWFPFRRCSPRRLMSLA